MPFIKFANRIIYWTGHAKAKMRFYRLSEQRALRVLNSPKRVEEGIAPNTVAIMQPASIKITAGKSVWKQEIWVMIQKNGKKTKIISAWRYPGKTKPRDGTALDFLRQEYGEYLKNETV